MMVKGCIFDRVRNQEVIADLCGATKHLINGRASIEFQLIDPDDPQTGLIRYSRFNLMERQERYASCGFAGAFTGSDTSEGKIPEGILKAVDDGILYDSNHSRGGLDRQV